MGKKFVSAALTATTSVWLSGAMLFVPVAQAQSVTDLQAQISALLAQIQQLQAQLGSQTGGSSASYNFTRDLTVGSKGDDVSALQQALISKGYLAVAAPTGYFGALTRAALAKWQAASGISPAAGYFGPKSRAAYAAMSAGGSMTGPSLPAPASGLAASLAADSATGSAIAGAGQIKAGKFNFTASNSGSVVVTGLEFKKVGVLSDSNINNLYLADGKTGEIVAQYQSLTNGLATFSGLSLAVGAGQTWSGELRMDLSSSASAGNTIAWQLSKVTTAGADAVSGMPTSNSLTVTTVSNPSIATLALTETIPNATTVNVDAGTEGALISSWTASVSGSSVNLANLQFTFVGSANPADIRNLKLKVNGEDVATVAQASLNTNFNFAGTPVKLKTGQSVIEVFGDVLGSPNRTFRFSLLQPYRVNAVDTQYNTGITVSITSGSSNVSINTGSITVSLASDTPTQPLPVNAAGVTIAKFRIYAAGEAVKVKYLDATLTGAGTGLAFTSATSSDANVQNVKLVDDAGGQVGNTITTIRTGTTSGTCTVTATTAVCHFGTSASPINYTVPANTARTLSLQVDLQSTPQLSTLQGSLPGNTSNLEGQISFQTPNSGAATGATLSITSSPLTVVANSGFVGPTYVAGSNNIRVASFVVSAASAQGARITSLSFDKDLFALDLQNMKVMVGSTQFGATRASLSTTAAEASIAFSGATPIQVPAGGSVVIDVYADVLTGSTSDTTVFDLIGWSALGNISNSSITFPTTPTQVVGQDITISSGPTLTVARASESAPSKQVVMGSTGNSLFSLRLTSDNVEDIRVTQLNLEDQVTGATSTGVSSFGNLTLWDGTTQIGGPLSLTMPGAASSSANFTLTGGGVIVPKNGTKNLELKGDVATFTSGGASSTSAHNFRLFGNVTSSVVSVGKDSNGTVTVSGLPNSNTSTVYRTKVALSSSLLGAASARTRVAVDDVATLNFAANSSYQALLGTVALKFSGTAASAGSGFAVDIIDANTNAALGSASQQTCAAAGTNSCTVTFSPQYTVDAGTTKAVKVRINSSGLLNAASQTDSLSVLVNGTTDVLINDGIGAGIPLESTVVPFTVVNVSYE